MAITIDNYQPTDEELLKNELATEAKEYTVQAGYYDFRFTFSDQDKDLRCLEDSNFINKCKKIYKELISHMESLKYFSENIYTSGFEIMNRKGDNCKAHMHLRFKSTLIKNSMHRTIKRYLESHYDQDTTGNKAMMFKTMIVPRNEEEFWRYPLKQNLSSHQRGFAPQELKNMHEIARASYEKTVQVAQAKIDKQDNNDSTFQKVLYKIRKQNGPNTSRSIAGAFIQHYNSEDRPMNRTTIDGYVVTATLQLNVITEDQLLDKWGY